MDVDTFMRELVERPDDVSAGSSGEAGRQAPKKKVAKKSQGQRRRERQLAAETRTPKGTKSTPVGKAKPSASSAKKPVVKKVQPSPETKKVPRGQHKKVIESLADADPEFYKFLQEEDKGLLNVNESSDESSGEEDVNQVEKGTKDEAAESDSDDEDVHRLPSNLVEQSAAVPADGGSSDSDLSEDLESDMDDESDEDAAKPAAKGKVAQQEVYVTAKMVEKWHRKLAANPDLATVDKLVKAFEAAVTKASGDDADSPNQYVVEGIVNFNAVVRTCLRNLPQAFASLLDYRPKGSRLPCKCSRWGVMKVSIRTYLSAVNSLLRHLAAAEVLNAVLKHATQLTSYIACFPKLTRAHLKIMIRLWSTSDDASRVLAFISIIRLVRVKQEDLLEKTLKSMYMAYVRNCKFTSANLLPSIGFMQHSLVEIFSLDGLLGYQYTFVYIRQLAIHLRNAMASKKKESYQAVYNWQYIHSCAFLCRLVSTRYASDENARQLLYPLVQVIIGCIRLIPTVRYIPLRFQCIRMLNLISQKTGVFVPTLSLLLEVLEITDFKKKMSRVSTRPLDFSCMLKLSKVQVQERGFKDGLMDNLYELILDHLVSYAHTVSFPEIVVPAVHQMKQFVKSCKIANFTKQIKQIILKVAETSRAVDERRRGCALNLADGPSVREWERQTKEEGTPLSVYYKKYRSLRDREVMLEITGKEQMESYDDTPIIPTGQQRRATETERIQFSSLFDQPDSGSDDEERFNVGKTSKQRKSVNANSDDDDSDADDASSLNSDELARLNRSGSDSEGGLDSDMDGSMDNNDREEREFSDNEVADDVGEDIVEDLELSDLDAE